LRAKNNQINIVQLFYITLTKIKKYLSGLRQHTLKADLNSFRLGMRNPLETIKLYTNPDIPHTNNNIPHSLNSTHISYNKDKAKDKDKYKDKDFAFIGLGDEGEVIAPQLTIGVKLENVVDVITAYLTNSGIIQLTILLENIEIEYALLKEIYGFSQRHYTTENDFPNPYTNDQIMGILFLLAIEMINRKNPEVNVPLLTYNRYTHIRLRYNMYTIFNFEARATKEFSNFGALLSDPDPIYDHYKIILYVLNDTSGEIGDFPDYDGNIVLLELRTFNDQLSKLIGLTKHNASKKESKNERKIENGNEKDNILNQNDNKNKNRNNTMDEYIKAIDKFNKEKFIRICKSKRLPTIGNSIA
jgi:hypothetical protein